MGWGSEEGNEGWVGGGEWEVEPSGGGALSPRQKGLGTVTFPLNFPALSHQQLFDSIRMTRVRLRVPLVRHTHLERPMHHFLFVPDTNETWHGPVS